MKNLIIKFKTYATREAFLKIPSIPPAIFFVLLIFVARLFVIIQIYKVHSWRFGHLIADSQIISLETKEWNKIHKKKKFIIFYFSSDESSNDYFVQKLKENHFHIQKRLGFTIFYFCNYFKFLVTTTDENSTDPNGLMIKNPPQIKFNSKDMDIGTKFLKKYGLEPESKYVCLHVRDAAFLGEENDGSKYLKHSTRNSSIENYKVAAETLADLGYSVFRMGSAVKETLDSSHPKVFDYATNGMRTEFLDIFLGAHCTFAVVTNSGWSHVPRIFGRPIIFVNSVPFFQPNLATTKALFYPKRIVDTSNHQPLSLNSLVSRGVILQSNKFELESRGVILEDLSTQDLVDAVIEMVQRVEMRFQQSEKSKIFYESLIRELKNDPNTRFTQSKFPIQAEYASSFLDKNPNLIEAKYFRIDQPKKPG